MENTNSSNGLLKREEIDPQYKWNLGDIYKDILAWEKDYSDIKKLIPEIAKYKGTLKESSQRLVECLNLSEKIQSISDTLFIYAKMKKDEDNTVPEFQALSDKAYSLTTEVSAALSFMIPEILSIKEDVLASFINNNNSLSVYKFFLEELIRKKSHTLSEREEEILALTSEMAGASKNIYTMYNNADIKFPFIKDEEGKEIELTKGRFISFLESKNRDVRKNAYDALYSTYQKNKNTIATILVSNIKKNKFYSSIRKYNSSLEYSLDDDNVSINVYDNLIDTINKNLHLLHRYLKLRKKILNLPELKMYDLYVPLIEENQKKYSYKEAVELVQSGLTPLGKEYLEYLNKGFESGWIDVYENEGKTSGAYSWGAYKTHPYVLLNFQGTINDVFTIAHEMGHALHSFYTNKTQPYVYSEYKIFVAEVASTVNETILMRYLLEKASSKVEKAYLLNHFLEEFRGTIFRQVMFAEFEKITHNKIQIGEALTAQELTNIYTGLNSKYFGNEVVLDDKIGIEWARIPHFYNSFYVYKYATGFSSAISISSQILNKGQQAVDKYISFLKSGGSNYPIELLKIANVDLSTTRPVEDALNEFELILNQLEEII